MRSHRRRSAEGSSAVEFVFILPVLVMLVFGIIQFGIAYNRSQGMHAAAREGARLASIGADVASIEARVGSALSGTTVGAADVSTEVRWYTEPKMNPSGKLNPDPAEKSDGTVVSDGDVPCDQTDAHTVRVDVEVTGNVSDYAITIPLLPAFGSTFPSEAIFRCEDQS